MDKKKTIDNNQRITAELMNKEIRLAREEDREVDFSHIIELMNKGL